MKRTVIIGGGIVGISTAWFLARRDHPVVVLDDGDLSSSASTGNAGIIAPGHPPLPQPGLVLQTLKWMLDPDSPLYVPLRLDPELAIWMARFALACRRSVFDRSMGVLSRLGSHAAACFEDLLNEVAIECHHHPGGFLDLYTTRDGLERGADEARRLVDGGYRVDVLDAGAVRRDEPALSEAVVGAVRVIQGCSLEAGALLRGLAAAARTRGVEFRLGTPVQRLAVEDDRAGGAVLESGELVRGDSTVLAAGAWSGGLARAAGLRIPMQGGKGYHVHVPMTDPPLTSACVHIERHVAMTPMGDRIRLAGTVELSGLNGTLRQRRIDMLSEAAAVCLPQISGAPTSGAWCGQRPCTADGLPVIGPVAGVRGLFLGTGHAKLGMTLGPITGRLLSEWILDGRPSVELPLLSPNRFARSRLHRRQHKE